MKRYICLIFLFIFSVCTRAQSQKQLDSLKYILPEFTFGTVFFSDKNVNQGMLNISPVDQAVYCLSPSKDTLIVSGNHNIVSVNVPGRSFIKWNDNFVEIVARRSDSGVGITRTTSKVNNVKAGAYGIKSSTQSVRTYAVDATSGNLRNIIIDDPRNYVYTKTSVLLNHGKFYFVSKNSFKKLFPEQKEYIDSVWAERNILPSDIDAVISFYTELCKKETRQKDQ